MPRPRANGDSIDSEGAGLFDFVTNNPSSKSVSVSLFCRSPCTATKLIRRAMVICLVPTSS